MVNVTIARRRRQRPSQNTSTGGSQWSGIGSSGSTEAPPTAPVPRGRATRADRTVTSFERRGDRSRFTVPGLIIDDVAKRTRSPVTKIRQVLREAGPAAQIGMGTPLPHDVPPLAMVSQELRTACSICVLNSPVPITEREMVRSRRLELPRPFGHNDLNVARLPVPPRPHVNTLGLPPWLAGACP